MGWTFRSNTATSCWSTASFCKQVMRIYCVVYSYRPMRPSPRNPERCRSGLCGSMLAPRAGSSVALFSSTPRSPSRAKTLTVSTVTSPACSHASMSTGIQPLMQVMCPKSASPLALTETSMAPACWFASKTPPNPFADREGLLHL